MTAHGEQTRQQGRAATRAEGWTLRYADDSAADGWEEVVRQFPGPTRRAYDALEADPFTRSDRQHRLRGADQHTHLSGNVLEQWLRHGRAVAVT